MIDSMIPLAQFNEQTNTEGYSSIIFNGLDFKVTICSRNINPISKEVLPYLPELYLLLNEYSTYYLQYSKEVYITDTYHKDPTLLQGNGKKMFYIEDVPRDSSCGLSIYISKFITYIYIKLNQDITIKLNTNLIPTLGTVNALYDLHSKCTLIGKL